MPPKTSRGTATRVFAVYPWAVPVAAAAFAAAFPNNFQYDPVTTVIQLNFTLAELGAVGAGGMAIVAGVFAKWGIKR